MPQKKYDLRNQFEKSARRYSNEEERLTQLQTVIDAHHKQAQMPKKYKLPTFDCPACHAKNIMFAGDAVAKNETILTLLEENGVADYVMSRLGRNYLQVGMYTDIVFPENDVRFIAINDNVDSAVQTEFDMTPIRNFCNELYARDTAKKIKSSFAVKGNHGEHLATRPPLGYKKDEKNPNKWIIDEPAAEIIRKIFKLCVSGMGPQI